MLACGLAALPARAQEGPLENTPPAGTTPEDIIKRFAAKETEFAKARDQYTYRQDVKSSDRRRRVRSTASITKSST